MEHGINALISHKDLYKIWHLENILSINDYSFYGHVLDWCCQILMQRLHFPKSEKMQSMSTFIFICW